MITQTLFDVGLLEVMDTTSNMPLTLNPNYQKSYRKLIDYIKSCVGQPRDFFARPYRIAGAHYIVIQIGGDKSRFNLTLSIAGYLQWPDLKSHSHRLYMDVTDSVDGYYLTTYLKQDLYTDTVDK